MSEIKKWLTRKMNGAGWNWMSTSEKYINIDQHDTEPRYWIAPFVSLNDNAVDAHRARGFTSLQELKRFIDSL